MFFGKIHVQNLNRNYFKMLNETLTFPDARVANVNNIQRDITHEAADDNIRWDAN